MITLIKGRGMNGTNPLTSNRFSRTPCLSGRMHRNSFFAGAEDEDILRVGMFLRE